MELCLDPPGGAKFIIQCGGACFSSSLIRMLVSYIRSLLLDGALFSSLIVIEEKESERWTISKRIPPFMEQEADSSLDY